MHIFVVSVITKGLKSLSLSLSLTHTHTHTHTYTDAIFSVIGKAMNGLIGSDGKEFEDSDPHYPVQRPSIEDKEDNLRER